MTTVQKSQANSLDVNDEIDMLRRIIRRVYQLALEEESLDALEHAAQTLSTAINRVGSLVKLQNQLGMTDRDEIIASFNEALTEVVRQMGLEL